MFSYWYVFFLIFLESRKVKVGLINKVIDLIIKLMFKVCFKICIVKEEI